MDGTPPAGMTDECTSTEGPERRLPTGILARGSLAERVGSIFPAVVPPGRTAAVLASVMLAVVALAVAAPGLTAAPPSGESGQTFVVDDDYRATNELPITNGTACDGAGYAEIQAAVDAAGPGDTVQVCEGTYAEQVTVSTADLTIEAAGQAAIEAAGWVVTINASGVRIRGFEVNANSGQGGIVVYANGTVVSNNSIHGAGGPGVYVPNPSTENVTIRHNAVDNVPSEGFPPDGITINGTATVRGNSVTHANEGIDILGTALVVNNTVTQSENGIDISHGHGRIFNNTVKENYNAGILFSHSFVGKNPFPNASGVVRGNRIVNNRVGVIVATYKTNPDNYEVHRNVILDNANFGIEVGNYNVTDNDSRVLNATNNYWACGGPSGGLEDPYTHRVANGTGDELSSSDTAGVSNVHFDPFRVNNPSACPASDTSLTPTPTPTGTATSTSTPTATLTATVTASPTPTPTSTRTARFTGGPDGNGTGGGTAINDGSTDDDGAGGSDTTDATVASPVTPPPTDTRTSTATSSPTPPPTPTISPTPVTEPGFGPGTLVVAAALVLGLLAHTRRRTER